MADTLSEIYNNTALGATELNDGEHTILTTDAATSYVIKDMNVSGSSDFKKTYLSLNGFAVGNVASNATGSLIIPPNSTLKIVTSDLPIKVKKVKVSASNTNGLFNYKEFYEDSLGNTYGDVLETVTGLSSAQNMADFSITDANNGNRYLHYVNSDNNSSHQVFYRLLSANTQLSLRSSSYNPMGLHDNKVYFFNGTSFQFIDLLTYPTTDSPEGFGSYSPPTAPSYPRGFAARGFFWYVPSESYQNVIYAINLSTGKHQRFLYDSSATGAGASMTSNNRSFGVSVDEINDKLYIYWPPTAGTHIIRTTYSTPWSSIVADSSAGFKTYTASENLYKLLPEGAASVGYMGSGTLGSTTDGGFTYCNSSGILVYVDKSFSTVKTLSGFGGISSYNARFVATEESVSPEAAVLAGVNSPTFGIQLLGVRSEI